MPLPKTDGSKRHMASFFTIGVAGHAGHGKTSLVRLLTGVETYRMPAEKRRGLTIESKAAPLTLASGKTLTLIDVPGTPKYLKNTIRGLCRVDLAILVIAADDGVMPQTRQHLKILEFLGAKGGVVVIGKTDLVDAETCALAEVEATELVESTFLDGCPVCHFSAPQEKGAGAILSAIEAQLSKTAPKPMDAPFRLWIDGVKRFAGIGTVVTGTVSEGTLYQNTPVELVPGGKMTRARFLESHGINMDDICAGQRVGINLHKIAYKSIGKGMVAAAPDALVKSRFINAEIHIARNGGGPIRTRTRLRLYIGTAAVNALMVIMKCDRLVPGEVGLVQFRLSEPLGCVPGDGFVLSLLNKKRVMAGGRVLEISDEKYRQVKDSWMRPRVQAIGKGDISGYLDSVFGRYPYRAAAAKDLEGRTVFSGTALAAEIQHRVRRGEAVHIENAGTLKKSHYDQLMQQVIETIECRLAKKTLKSTFPINEIADNMEISISSTVLRSVLETLCGQGRLLFLNGHYQMPAQSMQLSADQQKLQTLLMDFAFTAGDKPITAGHFCRMHQGRFGRKTVEKLLRHLESKNQLILLDDRRFITPQAVSDIKDRLQRFIRQNGRFSLQDCQTVFGYGRSQAVPVLEYLDELGFTIRQGNIRMLRE